MNLQETNLTLKNFESNLSYANSESDSDGNLTSITNLHFIPNSNLKLITLIIILFNIIVLILAIVFSFIDKNYFLNIYYLDEKVTFTVNEGYYESVFTMNKIMLYIIIFFVLSVEIFKLFYINFFSYKNFIKFTHFEMDYWYVIIKFLFGCNILLCVVYKNENNFIFIASSIINGLIIGKKYFFFKLLLLSTGI